MSNMPLIRAAQPADIATILRFVHELAAFEREPDAVEATEETLGEALFGDRPAAEAVIAERDGQPLGFALFFHNFSTWTGRRGLYLEDLYVTPDARGQGVGGALLRHLAGIAVARGCAVRMVGARLECGGDRRLSANRRGRDGGLDGAALVGRAAAAAGGGLNRNGRSPA